MERKVSDLGNAQEDRDQEGKAMALPPIQSAVISIPSRTSGQADNNPFNHSMVEDVPTGEHFSSNDGLLGELEIENSSEVKFRGRPLSPSVEKISESADPIDLPPSFD